MDTAVATRTKQLSWTRLRNKSGGGGELAKRASLDEDSSNESREMATDTMAKFTNKQPPLILLTRFIRFALDSLKMRLASLGADTKQFKKTKEGDPAVWGKSVVVIHASAEQAMAFTWCYCSNVRMKIHQAQDRKMLRRLYIPKAVEAGDHTQHIVVQNALPPPLQPRETNLRMVWGEIEIER